MGAVTRWVPDGAARARFSPGGGSLSRSCLRLPLGLARLLPALPRASLSPAGRAFPCEGGEVWGWSGTWGHCTSLCCG